MKKFRVLVADPISEKGINLLEKNPKIDVDVKIGIEESELLKIISNYHALIVRSQTNVNKKVIDSANNLIAIGRAGVGVDNIDIKSASERGIIVMNTPGGNTVSTAEHAFALMMAMARKITHAHASTISGKWERKTFVGTELNNKTLAVIGCGRVGTEFIKRAHAFNMKIQAYDPYISKDKADSLRIDLKQDVDSAIAGADFITLHIPSTDATRRLIKKERIAKMKDGAYIINCARGDLIDSSALFEALESGKISSAAIDVYDVEPPPADHPFLKSDKIILTPHLGASTSEAQESVGVQIAEVIASALIDKTVINSVNMPNIDRETAKEITPHLDFAKTLGKICSQIAPSQSDEIKISYSGKFCDMDTALITRSVLVGYLSSTQTEGNINFVNAPSVAKELGLNTSEAHLSGTKAFADLIEIDVWCKENKKNKAKIAGTYFGRNPRIVRINDKYVEVAPEGCLLLVENTDVPGIIGQIGTTLANHKVNIANMSLNRNKSGGTALAVLNLDSVPDEKSIKELNSVKGIINTKVIVL